MPKYKKYSDTELLQIIKNKHIDSGLVPKTADFPQSLLYETRKRFKSYRNTLALTGLVVLDEKEIELRNIIKKLYNELNRIPNIEDLEEFTEIPYNEFYKQFKSWNNALRQSEIKIPKYTDKQLLNYLSDLSIKLNRVPTMSDMKKYSILSFTVYVRRFGSWSNALMLAKLISNQNSNTTYSKTDLIKKLLIKHLELGRNPKAIEMHNPTRQTYRFKFGSWDNALKAAGLEVFKKDKKNIIKERRLPPKKYTKEFLCETLINLYKELKRLPTVSDLKPPYPSYKRYYDWFGSFEKALLEVNLVNQDLLYFINTNQVYGTPILLERLIIKNNELNRLPTPSDIEIDTRYYIRRYGTWNNALYHAGLLAKNNE